MGKDILTTHSVYWSTMLFALGLEPADIIYAHGWWTVEGQKMSKSLGNAVDPHLLIDCYGTDPLRYFLMREIPFGLDGDFSHSGFMTRYNADLANDLGNLAQIGTPAELLHELTLRRIRWRFTLLDPASRQSHAPCRVGRLRYDDDAARRREHEAYLAIQSVSTAWRCAT